KEAPTLNDLSEVMGSSHQNVKQILLKLENKGFVAMMTDEKDKRKQRFIVTDKCRKFMQENDNQNRNSEKIIMSIFEGVDDMSLKVTIETIIKMERNLSKI
ncbi:MAG: winged helix DNA-binding protein, partial [Lachnospiraceae bacterium]|nr:winged helix DNA-binding protein [Lachnospiraceae bacterium]